MFFKDDFYLFNQVIFHSPLEWFNPFLPKAYRPLGAELYYALVHFVGFDSYWFAALLSLATFVVGLWFLYKIAKELGLAKQAIFVGLLLFATSANRLYQLVWLATYQEVLMFTFTIISFWAYRKNNVGVAFFALVGAVLAKETAIVFPLFFIAYEVLLYIKTKKIQNVRLKAGFFITYVFFVAAFGVARYAPMAGIAQAAEYTVHLSPRLMFQNTQWYFLWSLGVPVYFPDFLPRLFSPSPRFWEFLQNPFILWYLRLLLLFWVFFGASALFVLWKKQKELLKNVLNLMLCGFGFIISLIPVLPIIHRWPVRLLVPMVFICIPMAFVLYHLPKKLSVALVILYLLVQGLGWYINDDLSTFALERKVSQSAQLFVETHTSEILTSKLVCFYDELPEIDSAWQGAQKLRTTMHNEEGVRYFLKDKTVKTVYVSGKGKGVCPPNSYQVDAAEIMGKSR